MPQFNRYIGIDDSGAETAGSSCTATANVQGSVAKSTFAGLPWLLHRQSMPKQKTDGPVETLRAYSPAP